MNFALWILSNDKDSVLDKVESNLQIKALYKKLGESLTGRESSILIMRYGLIDGKCKTQREIAMNLGISRSYVSRIEKKALKKLKKELFITFIMKYNMDICIDILIIRVLC